MHVCFVINFDYLPIIYLSSFSPFYTFYQIFFDSEPDHLFHNI